MKQYLVIEEKYSKFWPLIAMSSLIISVILLISTFIVSGILLEGTLRMAAFVFFAVSLLSLLKLKDGRMEISVKPSEPGEVQFTYKVRDKIMFQEVFKMDELHSLKIDEMPNRSLYNDIVQSDRCIRFRRENEAEWNYLNRVNGRVIPLSNDSAKKLHSFLRALSPR